MAYSEKNLQPIGGQAKAGTAPQMWSYTAPGTDAIADINTEGYFNSAADVLKVGDLIYVWDSSVPTGTLVIVLSNTGTVVDVSDGTAVAVADAD
tara:strand:+ start:251 stop:532 length:282 start_codon:yes stop_codon:yes gene_type:complete